VRYRLLPIVCLVVVTPLQANKGGDATGSSHAVDVSGVMRSGGKPVIDAVAWLEAPTPRRPSATAVITQKNMAFLPRVLAIQVGTTVEFPNDDRVFHNVFSFHDGKRFDLGMYPVGTTKRVTFDRPGLSRLFCNIHPHMAAYVIAVPSPYFAVSGDDGRFTLRAVPAGSYTYHAWRAGSAIVDGSITIGTESRLDVSWP
jgi:plastocyanin